MDAPGIRVGSGGMWLVASEWREDHLFMALLRVNEAMRECDAASEEALRSVAASRVRELVQSGEFCRDSEGRWCLAREEWAA